MMDKILPALFVVLFSTAVTCNNSSVGTQLYRNLLLNYEKNVRPGLDYNYPTMVKCQFIFVALTKFEEIDSKFSILGAFNIEWFDERLMWDPYRYGNISSITIPQELLWKPDLVITNAYTGVQFLTKDGVCIRVQYDGSLTWVTGDKYEIYCDADITFYPVDTQTCSIQMITWNSFPFEVTIDKVSTDTTSSRNLSRGNPSWDVKEITMKTSVNQVVGTLMVVDIKLKRLSEYIVINIILPVGFISAINIFVFVLPAESGERIGFSITLLLSLAVFMTILSDSLPKSSRPQIATLCYFLFSQLVISILMMIFTICGLRFYYMMPDKPIPVYLKAFSRTMDRVWFGRNRCCKLNKQVASMKQTSEHIPDSDKQENNFKNEPERPEIIPDQDKNITWLQIANYFDNFCIIFFIILIVVTDAFVCVRLASH